MGFGAWNHQLYRLALEELQLLHDASDDWESGAAERALESGQQYDPHSDDVRCPRFWEECSIGRCHSVALFCATYDYITGRRGNVSYQARQLCPKHAEAFRKKYGLI